MLMPTGMKTFADWLNSILNKNGWSQSELARRAGLNQVTISRILSEERKPGLAFCRAISRTLNLPETYVLRKAGLVKEIVADDDDSLERIIESLRMLSATDREVVANLAQSLIGGQRAREANEKTNMETGPGKARSKRPT